MAKRRYTSEEIIHKLREVDVSLGQGKTIAGPRRLSLPPQDSRKPVSGKAGAIQRSPSNVAGVAEPMNRPRAETNVGVRDMPILLARSRMRESRADVRSALKHVTNWLKSSTWTARAIVSQFVSASQAVVVIKKRCASGPRFCSPAQRAVRAAPSAAG